MEYKKERLRALRLMLMLTQSQLADLIGVKVLSVKRWESPDYDREPPAGVLDELEKLIAEKRKRVAALLDMADEHPDIPVLLPLYRDREHYLETHADANLWQLVNAISLSVGEQLLADGRGVNFTYNYDEIMRENSK